MVAAFRRHTLGKEYWHMSFRNGNSLEASEVEAHLQSCAANKPANIKSLDYKQI
jgi:hypothetical protein